MSEYVSVVSINKLGKFGKAGWMRENRSKIATREEGATALHELSDVDLARLETIARIRAIGLRALDWHDLLHDAIDRLLDRKRK